MQEGALHTTQYFIKSQLSFKPLVSGLKKNIEEGNMGMKKLYGQVVKEFESHPELLSTITDFSIIKSHEKLIEELLSAVFPPTTANYMYGVSVPFNNQAVYASPLFSKLLLKPGNYEISIPEIENNETVQKENLHFAFGLILKKYLGYNSPDTTRSIYPYKDEKTGLTRFMEIRLDARFIDVLPAAEMPEMPASIIDSHTNRIMTIEELMGQVNIENFIFEGVALLRVNDITEQAIIAEMKNRLIDVNAFSDATIYDELEKYIQSLIGITDLTVGVTPFFKLNRHYVYSDLHNNNSILFKHFHTTSDKDEISDYCKLLFRDSNRPLLFETISNQSLEEVQCLQYYHKEGAQSLIIYPLKLNNELLGMLEVVSQKPQELKPEHINKIEAAIPLFTVGLEKSLEQLNYEVDKVIKKNFTAIQPSVEWKFTETALNYIVKRHTKEDSKIDRINFDDVYPLYAAIDIRNSSTERSHAIQSDILEQLEMAKVIVQKIQAQIPFPLLQEMTLKLDQHINAASDVLESEEELIIREFMTGQVASVFHHLLDTEPSLKKELDNYFTSIDPKLGLVYHHRKEYEQSVSRINDTLARFIDKEQVAAQKVFPHYFERFVTDGVEFNIYIGQSISPRKKFDEIYLRNMKMWQLTIITKAARAAKELEKDLSLLLQTTQLILSHNQTLSILFRTEERKFDVDGTYNIRYEIVKKRIDKVCIRDTKERLTQPGKIAIVYSQAKDAEEYIEYIEFLQNKNLLKPGIEKHELEELQGVSGLKALRVDINFDDLPAAEKKADPSIMKTNQQVLQK